MSSIKLTYFTFTGRAGVARQILTYNDVDFVDERLKEEEWVKRKPSTPFGQLPTMEVDGVLLAQSNAINRFLARKYKMTGRSPVEEAQADMIVDFIEECFNPMVRWFVAPENEKPGILKKWTVEHLPRLLTKLEKILVDNKGGDGYLVGDALTWADLTICNHLSELKAPEINVNVDWSMAPKLQALVDRVEGQPKIAEWIAKNRGH